MAKRHEYLASMNHRCFLLFCKGLVQVFWDPRLLAFSAFVGSLAGQKPLKVRDFVCLYGTSTFVFSLCDFMVSWVRGFLLLGASHFFAPAFGYRKINPIRLPKRKMLVLAK